MNTIAYNKIFPNSKFMVNSVYLQTGNDYTILGHLNNSLIPVNVSPCYWLSCSLDDKEILLSGVLVLND